MAKIYKVTAPLVIANRGASADYVYQDAPLPADTNRDQVKRLLAMGMIEEMEDVAEEQPPAPSADVDLSSLTYAELQTLAKSRGIPANQSADELVKALSVV